MKNNGCSLRHERRPGREFPHRVLVQVRRVDEEQVNCGAEA